jgi:hypothetical protein
MADYDPNRLDPNRPDYRNSRLDPGPGMNWNWILGGIAVVVVLLIALSYMGGDNRTAGTSPSPSATTTGQGLPRTAPSTTGQSTPSPMAPSPTAPSPSAPKQ